ncbi:MAG: DNA-processing protein DprA [Spirochaetales bacterium]|nr:DNA-processing protein DprA [Spirochaetales bacterium]
MNIDCIEIERRLAIGFNEHLSLAARHRLVCGGQNLEDIPHVDERFNPYIRETRDVLHWLSRSPDNSIIWYGDKEYPSFNPLRAHLPYMLFCTGTKPDMSLPCAAVVGTRHATYAALQQAFRMGMEATENGLSVISGFAEGIDQAGMTGALKGHGPCIGVLACGHDVEYPCLTMEMRRRIVDSGGCVISRFAPQTPSYKSNFLSRNIIIAAYGSFIVAVQAPGKSGTLSTCEFAMQMGKDVYVGSQGVGDRFVQAGTTALFSDGVKVIGSITEVDGLQHASMVVEAAGCVSASNVRFGDCEYMVKKAVS